MKKAHRAKWLKNTWLFLKPALVVSAIAFLGYLSDALPPVAGVFTPLALYLINVAIDYLKKQRK